MAKIISSSSDWVPNQENVNVKGYRHGEYTFNKDVFQLLPKSKYLFHVSFGINSAAVSETALLDKHKNEINMLVKSVDLPKFKITTKSLHQYNRIKVVQIKHDLPTINIKFHDDNASIINHLWQNYYNYYYADLASASKVGAFDRNATKNKNYIITNYGLDNWSSGYFFNYIKIYQMARQEYMCHKLLNPIITELTSPQLSYSTDDPTEYSMNIAYEAVDYSYGNVKQGEPEGFGYPDHYDTSPSPLTTGSVDETISFFVGSSNNSTISTNTNTTSSSVESITVSGFPGSFSSITSSYTPDIGGMQDIIFPMQTNFEQTVATQRNFNET